MADNLKYFDTILNATKENWQWGRFIKFLKTRNFSKDEIATILITHGTKEARSIWKHCERKVSFSSPDKALHALEMMKSHGRTNCDTLNVYKCHYGNRPHWHLENLYEHADSLTTESRQENCRNFVQPTAQKTHPESK